MFGGENVIITVLPCVALCVRVWTAFPIGLSMIVPSVWWHYVSGYGAPVMCKIVTPELCPRGTSVMFSQIIAP